MQNTFISKLVTARLLGTFAPDSLTPILIILPFYNMATSALF